MMVRGRARKNALLGVVRRTATWTSVREDARTTPREMDNGFALG
jgi:hypothetical protein